MRQTLRAHLSYANVVSTLCLFLLLGGGAAIAANQLGKNSVGSRQLRKNSVTAAKIKNGVVTGAKLKLDSLGTVPSATNAVNATNATRAGSATTATTAANATQATTAANATGLGGPLAAGQTLSGIFSVAGHRNGSEFTVSTTIQFQIPLAFKPVFHEIAPAAAPTSSCPGSAADPSAAAGQLCVYDYVRYHVTELAPQPIGSGRYGVSLIPFAATNMDYEVFGTWAVTAP
jgi:hypothetical protein